MSCRKTLVILVTNPLITPFAYSLPILGNSLGMIHSMVNFHIQVKEIFTVTIRVIKHILIKEVFQCESVYFS